MRRIAYTSKFIKPIDSYTGNRHLRGMATADTLEQAYELVPNLHANLFNAADKWCERHHFGKLQEHLDSDRAKNKTFHEIESDCGDDEVVTTDSRSYGPLKIVAGEIISSIILSHKDTGISSQIYNYTEGWIITPPTRESCYEAVTRRHQREGVPALLDPVKLKLCSAVRKQSQMDLDLESKIKKVFENTSWVARHQFSYPYHQLMEIIAVNVFDFRDSRSFPYLYESEGGCGGLPPFGNIDTVISGVHAFHKGKASRTVYGLMDEATRIHMGDLQPKDSFFLRSSHIAQLGDESWEKYDRVYRELREGRTPAEAADLLSILADKKNLPGELLEKAAVVEPTNVVMGTALSHLRSDDFIMTELDVKLQLENRKKTLALGGTTPYRIILQEIEAEKEKIKSNSWKVLGDLAHYLDVQPGISAQALANIPGDPEEYMEKRDIINKYYTLRTERHTLFSSFAYTDALRVFKTTDVLDYISRHGNVLRVDVSTQVHPRLKTSVMQDIIAEKLRKESIFHWMNSADLTELLSNPLPPGVGPDDGRILTEVLTAIRELPVSECEKNPPVFILLSGDKQLIRGINTVLRTGFRDRKWLVIGIDQSQYIGLCLRDCQNRALGEPEFDPKNNVKLYNYITHGEMVLPKDVIEDLRKRVRQLQSDIFNPIVFYDYPNLERSIEPTSYEDWNNTVIRRNGGFLRVETIENFPPLSSWGALPLDRLWSLPDFNQSTKTIYPVSQLRWGSRSFFNKPLGTDTLRSISAWTDSIN